MVVTFNRQALLERLVDRLGSLDSLDEILVVDNASTDTTSAWLAERSAGHTEIPVLSHTLASNTGGAGGFAHGLSWALERGADLIWLMDDDGVPDPECLDDLLAHGEREGDLEFWGPIVVDEAAPQRLVFPIRLPGTTKVAHRVSDVEASADAATGLLNDIVIPFNGVLVTRALVEQIGIPRAEFFIWGDDHEYRLRAEAAGARIATVASARFLHPSVGELGTPMAWGKTTYNHSPSDLKHYCMARNNFLNLRAYRGLAHALAFVAKTLWFYTFTRPSLSRLRLSASAWRAALRGDFTGHERFLA